MIAGLTESFISDRTARSVYQRGVSYYEMGAVVSIRRIENTLHAVVEGSEYDPYDVRIDFDDAGIDDADCTCPFDGGWCKHVVAALLMCYREPDRILDMAPLNKTLESLTREELVALVERLAVSSADVAREIQRFIHTRAGHPSAQKSNDRKTVVDQNDIRQRVASIVQSLGDVRSSRVYRHTGRIASEVRNEIERATSLLDADDGLNALRYLEAITDAYEKNWVDFEDSYGELGAVFDELGSAFCEALLTADLTPDERDEWAVKLLRWEEAVEDFGIECAFRAAITAAGEGWDDPDLQATLDGSGLMMVRSESEDDWADASAVTWARLKVLERRGHYDQYLRLAAASGHLTHYLLMLVRTGATDRAVDQALTLMTEADQAFDLARALRERGALEEALTVAEKGLTLEGIGRIALPMWTSELAESLGGSAGALEAALVAVRHQPSLGTYQRVEELAGDEWPHHRDALLEEIKSWNVDAANIVEILLYEGLIQDAVSMADQHPHNYGLHRRVVGRALEAAPEWVVRVARRHAEDIMDHGRSTYYQEAVDWLAHARDAYVNMDAADEWNAYLESIRQAHGRKHKLMGVMRERRLRIVKC